MGSGVASVKYVLTLTADSYNSQEYKANQLTAEYKGTFSVSGTSCTRTLTEIGKIGLGSDLTNVTKVNYYKDGTAEFTTALGSNVKTATGSLAVVASVLTIKLDENGDGSMNASEVMTYTKQ